ncbi:MAG: serine hydrolase [Clostridia bacterium]|nr:serine hydrolase [Clostridia bacterium]
MYKHELERVTPESVGISSRKLLEMVKSLEKITEMHGLMVARHGKVILEGWWKPYTADLPHICHSFGKSYVGTAVGLAITEGYLHLDDHITDLFAGELQAFHVPLTENLKKLTIEHQLMMANGMSVHAASGEHLLRNYLTTDVDHEPGKRFLYNTTGSCMLGAAVMRTTGKSIRQYLTEGIFDKIGIESDKLEWMSFHHNGVHAAPGVAATTENNLRLGMLYLQYGAWNGEQLIDREWMERATTRRIRTDVINAESHTDTGAGYGYQLWICEEPGTFKFAGGHGQDSVMSRPNDLVISINQSANDGMSHAENEILSEYLLRDSIPDAALPDDPEAFQALQDYMAGLALPSLTPSPLPYDAALWDGIYRLDSGDVHVNTELRPMTDANVYTDFYDHDDVICREFSLEGKDGFIEVVLDDGTIRTVLKARLDGVLEPIASVGAIPIYRKTVSTAEVTPDSLIIRTKFLQTCFWSTLIICKDPNGGISIECRKERLHEDKPYFTLCGHFCKII